jgi:hypothetical protein
LVEEYPGAGADLAFGDPQTGEVGEGGGARVAWCDEQALLAPPQVEQVGAAVAKQGTGKRRVVDAAVVAQMDRGAIGPTPGQGAQSMEASAGADGTTVGPTWPSTICSAGSSLPASRNTLSACSRRAAAIAPSVATRARRRSANVIAPPSARYR